MSEHSDIQNFLRDPHNFLYALDWRNGHCSFIKAERDQLAELPFLDHRTLTGSAEHVSLPIQDITHALSVHSPAPLNFLFHSAFCCSTLIARCLDVRGKNLSLKEPFSLLGLSGYLRNNNRPQMDALLKITLTLLGRRFSSEEKVLIKPSNGANNILSLLLAQEQKNHTVLLYGDLDSFMASVIGGGAGHVDTIKHLAKLFCKDFSLLTFDLDNLNPFELSALVWGLQLNFFDQIASQTPDVKTLHCDDFLQAPKDVLEKLNRHYQLHLSVSDINNMLNSVVFHTHAKHTGRHYSAEARMKDKQATLDRYSDEINKSKEWLRDNVFEYSGRLSNPL